MTIRRGPTRSLSTMIDDSIANALDKEVGDGLISKRVHVERALLSYLGAERFESIEEYERLIKTYGME